MRSEALFFHLSQSLILLFLAINGYIYGNLPGLEMCADTPMSWHLFGMGSEIDIHAAYFYGHTFTSRDQRADVVGLFPATFITAEMTPGSPGRWLITCQVNEHLRGTLPYISLISLCWVWKRKHRDVSRESRIWHFFGWLWKNLQLFHQIKVMIISLVTRSDTCWAKCSASMNGLAV